MLDLTPQVPMQMTMKVKVIKNANTLQDANAIATITAIIIIDVTGAVAGLVAVK